MKVKISPGNSKMGAIASVSLPAIKTCRKNCACSIKCYAHKLERIRKSVREAYEHNLRLLLEDPDTYWREVEGAIMANRFFRFHVSGDIPDKEYLLRMLEVTKRNPHCQILCFTKMYELVNEVRAEYGEFPSNLHLIFSVWPSIELVNPYNFPTAHVRFKDGTTTADEWAVDCGGNCTECAITDEGCWVLEFGGQIVFDEH